MACSGKKRFYTFRSVRYQTEFNLISDMLFVKRISHHLIMATISAEQNHNTMKEECSAIIERLKAIYLHSPNLPIRLKARSVISPLPTNEAQKLFQFLTKMARTPVDLKNSDHIRMLNALYKTVTNEEPKDDLIGSHWEEIGFQKADPSTDCRASGLLGILFPLILFCYFPKTSALIKQASQTPKRSFPLMITLVVYVSTVLDAINENELISNIEDFHNGWNFVCNFYAGLVATLAKEWIKGIYTLADSKIFDTIAENAKKQPWKTIREIV